MTSPLNAFLLSRRRVLQGGAALSAAAFAGRGASAAPAKPLTFIGWQYHPEIVEQNVDTFKKLYDEDVDLRTGLRRLPSRRRDEAHRRPARRHDVFRGGSYRPRWNAAELDARLRRPARTSTRSRRRCFPSASRRLSLPSGKIAGLPYYAGHNAFIYNEEHLSKAGAAGSRQLGHASRRLPQAEEGRISESPYNSAWGRSGPSLHGACSPAGTPRARRCSTTRATSSTTPRCARSSKCTGPSTRSSLSRPTS